MTPFIHQYYTSGKASPTLSINEKCKALVSDGKTVYRFGFGQSPFPIPKIVTDALKVNAHQKDYLSVKGLEELRKAVSKYNYSKGIISSAENILIGPGSKNLIYLLQLVLKGELLLPAPSWVSYAPQAMMIGKPYSWLETKSSNNWMLAPETLENHCLKNPDTQKLLILNYPSNPVGASYIEEELKALATTARKYKVIILSDEIYGELYFENPHLSLASYYPEGTIVSSGLSKWCGAGGWRLGTFTFPKNMHNVLEAVSVAASETYSAVSAPIQFAAIQAYKGHPKIEAFLIQSRHILKSIANRVSKILSAAHIAHPHPQGGFYLLPDFEYYREKLEAKNIKTSDELCDRLLSDTGVALLPGTAFGMPADRLQARLSFVDFDGQKALELVKPDLDEEALNQIAGHMMEGLKKMVDWLMGRLDF